MRLAEQIVISIAFAALSGCAPPGATSTPDDRPPRVGEPALARMSLAEPVDGKIGVPVDVRYLLQGVAAKDQAATLQLAFVPRVAGTNLRVEFPASENVAIEAGSAPLSIEKADAAGAYRRSLLVTPRSSDSTQIRAIVTMDVDGGRYAGIYTIPIGAGATQ